MTGLLHGFLKALENGYWGWAVLIFIIIVIYSYSIYSKQKNTSKEELEEIGTQEEQSSKTVFDDEFVEVTIDKSSTDGLIPSGATLNHGQYKILQHLSHGGFGNTYLVSYDNGYRAAVKELFVREICVREEGTGRVHVTTSLGQATFNSLRRKFMKEAQRLQSLNNPYIVNVYGSFEDNGTAYYVMDYIAGKSLKDLLEAKGRISEASMRRILPTILDALRYIHNQHIWHLDLKPANIMLRDPSTAVLIDFGASKQYEDSYGQTLPSSSQMCYTQGFAPPEQMARPAKNIGAWTDIYALGATLYQTLTGLNPPNTDEILTEGLPLLPTTLSPQMIMAITAMLQPNRRLRPQSVDEVERIINLTNV